MTVSLTFMRCCLTMTSRISLRAGALVSILKGNILDCLLTFMRCCLTMASSIPLRAGAIVSISKGNILDCFTYVYEMLSHNDVSNILEGRCTCKYFKR